MSNHADVGEAAVARHHTGCNCAQAVLSVWAAELGLDEATAMRLAGPFGGGMGRSGQVCGAVTGALMALGLRHGADAPDPAAKEAMYQRANAFLAQFAADHGSILCPELLGCDLSTPEGRQQMAEQGLSRSVCDGLIRDAAVQVKQS